MSRVSPIQIGRLILEPIRYFFQNHAPIPDFVWDPDPKKSKIDISMFNDLEKETFDFDVQILVSRGNLQVDKSGLSDSMAEQDGFSTTRGLTRRKNFLIYHGQASVIIKARKEGTVELLTDIVMHIIQWLRPHMCDALGFKDFGLPMSVSPPEQAKPNVEVFQVQIEIPYIMEELWQASNDALRLRDVLLNITK